MTRLEQQKRAKSLDGTFILIAYRIICRETFTGPPHINSCSDISIFGQVAQPDGS